MSGSPKNLETEMLIGYDNIAHAIQQALNVVEGDNPKLAIVSYEVETEARVNYSDEIEDDMPNMGATHPLYRKEVLHEFDHADESDRK